MLLDIDGRRFAGCPDNDDSIGSFLYMEIDQLAQTRQVKASILVHRRDKRNNGSSNRIHE